MAGWGSSGAAALALAHGRRAAAAILLTGLAVGAADAEPVPDPCSACEVQDGTIYVVLVHSDDVVATVSGTTITCTDATTSEPTPCLRAAKAPTPEALTIEEPGPSPGLPSSGGACRKVTRWETGCVYGRPLEDSAVAETLWTPGDGSLASPERTGSTHAVKSSPWLVPETWARRGAAEHASIASFAKYSLRLAAAGAPLSLLGEVARAQADEVRHAEDAYALASALSNGGAARPGPLAVDADAGAVGPTPASTIVLDTWRAGCVAETASAAAAVADAAGAEAIRDHPLGPRIRDALARVAVDERGHSALAWRALAWAVRADAAANATLAKLVPSASDDELERALILPAARAVLSGDAAPAFDVPPALDSLAEAVRDAISGAGLY